MSEFFDNAPVVNVPRSISAPTLVKNFPLPAIAKPIDGNYFLIDINPRFSAEVTFSHFIGYNMVTSHFNCLIDKPILPPIAFEEQIICKRCSEKLLRKP